MLETTTDSGIDLDLSLANYVSVNRDSFAVAKIKFILCRPSKGEFNIDTCFGFPCCFISTKSKGEILQSKLYWDFSYVQATHLW